MSEEVEQDETTTSSREFLALLEGKVVPWEKLSEDLRQRVIDSHHITSERRALEYKGESLDSDWWREREANAMAAIKRAPRLWSVAKCSECEWTSGGWLTDQAAWQVATRHRERTHK